MTADGDPSAAAEAAKNRGNARLADGDLDQAARCYEEALRIQPDYAEACVNLGFVLGQLKRHAEAENLLVRAAALKPSLWQAHLNLGIVFQEQRRYGDAVACYEKAAALAPDRAECHWRLGNALQAQKEFPGAVAAFEKALALDPRLAEIHANLGTALFQSGRLDEAIERYRRSLAIGEHHVTHFLAGTACQAGHRWQQAVDHYRRALALAPDYSPAHFNLALLLLLLGDYANGLAHFERRLVWQEDMPWLKPIRDLMAGFGPERYWRGESLAGKRLLVWTEQGLGDALMLLRYLPLLKKDKGAGELLVVCDAPLERVVRNLPEVDAVIVKPAQVRTDRFDKHCSIMSLPCLFGTRLESIPPAPYLQMPEREKADWSKRLSPLPGLKAGLAWAGNKALEVDAARSIPLRKFAPLFGVAGVTWVSLQKGEPAAQLKEVGWPILDWMDECGDMQDTGALMANLDLVISVDTSVVHLAGALGRPVWLLNRYGSEWRWLLEREDSPWYPSLRIFRQPAAGDWDGAIAKMTNELESLVRAGTVTGG